MSPERRQEIEELFLTALDVDAQKREAFLAESCSGDTELHREVKALLRAHEWDDGPLDHLPSSGAPSAAARTPADHDRHVGPYRLHHELGRGGMGIVYFAERDDGQFRRQVALKLLRYADPRLSARIVAERQILASLQHPNIATLLDGGTTDDGRPYLVVEYVNGLPIDVYCDRMRLGIDERVRLFVAVARAVDYAHRNLIVHRDLKPSNILVTTNGDVKLLDFGIAKLLNPVLGPGELALTQPDQRALTPEYASPEQVRGEVLSTASDVYSLGVVLYRLLTGTPPYRLDGRTTPEVLDLVCETDPEPPSVRVTHLLHAPLRVDDREVTAAVVAETRATTTDRLRRGLEGDLDAIVMTALRKEPGARYGSAELLAQDLGNFLEGLPVQALRGNRTYRLRKLARRHRAAATAAALVLGSLLAGAAVAAWQASVARVERDRAERALLEAQQALLQSDEVTDFLLGLFQAADPGTNPGGEITVRDMVRRGVARADELAAQPLVQARLLAVVGSVTESMGRYDEAQRLTERALRTREAHAGMDSPESAAMLVQLANILRWRGTYDSAAVLLDRAADIQRRTLGPDHRELGRTLELRMAIAVFLADFEGAERIAREALEIRRSAFGADHALTLDSRNALARVLRRRGKLAEAEAALRQTLALREQTGAAETLSGTADMMQLAVVLREQTGRLDEAETLNRRALGIRRRLLGELDTEMVWPLESLALVLAEKGDFDGAEPLLLEALELRRRAFGRVHPVVAESMGQLGEVLRMAGRYSEAEAYLREALEQHRELLGEDHPRVSIDLLALGELMLETGRTDEAERLVEEAVARRRRAFGAENPGVGEALNLLGSVYLAGGRLAGADTTLHEALRLLRMQYQSAHPQMRSLHSTLARLYDALGQPAEARASRDLAGVR